jgi:hypothetical protein
MFGSILTAKVSIQMLTDSWMQVIYHGNVYSALFNSTYSIELENQYSNLSNCSELSSPGLPKATSSPNKETKLKPDKNEHKKKLEIKYVNLSKL